MATTWGDLKGQLVDLGFEEDEIVNEYGRLMRNSVNRALDMVYYWVVPQIEGYYKRTESWGYEDENGEWVLPKPKHITEETEDEQRVNMADNLMPLVVLIAAYYVWLDDDITKATMYWNQFDQAREQIIAVCNRPKNAVIEGGVRF